MNGGVETAPAIGRAIARKPADAGYALQLAARDPARLEL